MEAKPEVGPSGLANLNKWDPSAQQAFIQPAAHNNNGVRVAAILTAAALASKGTLLLPGNLSKVTSVFTWSIHCNVRHTVCILPTRFHRELLLL